MRRVKGKILLLLMSVITIFIVGACGYSKGEVLVTESAQKEEKVFDKDAEIEACTLHVVTMMGGEDPNAKPYESVLKEFKKKYPQITIEDESVSSDNDWKVQMEANFIMDNEPDVFQYFTDGTAVNILRTNKFVPLSEIQEEDSRIAANVTQISLEQTKSPLDGINYAVPSSGFWEGLYCNKDLFDRYDLELPTTWKKLMKAIKVFNENGIVPISAALNDIPNYWIETLILTASNTAEYIAVPNEAPEAWIEGLEKIQELYNAGAFSKDVATIDNEMAMAMFRNKKSAMQLDGSWFLNGVIDQENTVVCAFPAWEGAKIKKGTVIQGYSSGFYITKKAWEDPNKRKAALEFVYANTNDEQMLKYWRGAGICPVPVPAGMRFTKLQQSGAEYVASITNPVSPIDSRVAPEAFNELKDRFVSIALGKVTPEEAIEAMIKTNRQMIMTGEN